MTSGEHDPYGAVGDWMTKEPLSVEPECSISDALARMSQAAVRHLLVTETGCLVGIVSYRDWRRARAHGVSSAWESEPISRIMTDEPVTVDAETSVRLAARMLLERKIGCLPVRAGNRIVGIFTTSDALEALLSALG
jgi:acetoin utilization protein AcuB